MPSLRNRLSTCVLVLSVLGCGRTPRPVVPADVLPHRFYSGWTNPNFWAADELVLEATGNTFRIAVSSADRRARGEYGRGTLRREQGQIMLHFSTGLDAKLKPDVVLKEVSDALLFEFWVVDEQGDPFLDAKVLLRPRGALWPGQK